jgi:hypothetical protein
MAFRIPIWLAVLTTAAFTSCGGGMRSVTSTGGPVASGTAQPITVQQLITRSADTPVAVKGLLLVAAGMTRLCGAVLESYPVQCGEPSVELVGLDLAAVHEKTTAQGVTWKEGVVLDLQRMGSGRYAVLGSHTKGSVDIVLGLYSGVPDPRWTLAARQATELATLLARLTRVGGTTSPGGLGYHGFTIVGPDGTLLAFQGKVTRVAANPPYYLDDPDGSVERFLLETARPHLKPNEFAVVRRAISQP